MARGVTVDFNANIARFTSAIDKATNDLNRFQSNASRMSANVNRSFSALGVGLSVAGFAAFIKSNVDALDKLNDLRKSTNLTAEQLSGLSLAARQSGSDIDSTAASINRLATNIGKNEEKFRALGITAKDPLEAFKQFADVFNAIEDPFKRDALAVEALGKSWQGVAPLLAEGGKRIGEMIDKGERLSGVTRQMAEDADKFNDQMAELSVSTRSTAYAFTAQLLPGLNDVTKAMADAARDGGILNAIFVGLGGTMAHLFGLDDVSQAKDRLAEINQEIAKLTGQMAGGSKQTDKGIVKMTAQDTEALVLQLKKLGQEKATLDSIINPKQKPPAAQVPKDPEIDKKVCEFNGGVWDGKKCIKKTEKPKKNDGSNLLSEEMKDTAALTLEIGRLNDVEKSNIDLLQEKLNAFSGMDPALKAYNQSVIDTARSLEVAASFEEAFSKGLENEAAALNQADEDNQAFRDSQEKGYTDLFNQLERENEDLNVAFIASDRKRIAEQLRLEHERAVASINDKNLEENAREDLLDREARNFEQRLKQSAQNTNSFGKELGLTFTSAFEDAVAGGKKLSELLDALAKDIEKLLVRRTITDPLTQGLDKLISDSGISDFLSGIFNFKNADGNAFDSSGILPFASGGVVNGPTLFKFGSGGRIGVMGEEDTEAILPLKRGSNGDLGVNADGLGGVNVTVNLVESPGNGGQVQQRQDGGNTTIDIMVEKIESAMGRNIQQGRGLAPAIERQYGLNRAAGAY